jgi:2,4-dienoyl-CoA reductase-like NADH-dependent reductase (Old Yellow Enzyme family)
MFLSFRISNWGVADAQVSLFESKEEWQQIIAMLDASPVDVISVSTLNFKDKAFGTEKNMAQLTREATKKPLMICGRIYDRATADEAIQDADIALSGKSLLLNPQWVADIREDKPLRPRTNEESNVAYTETPLP